MCSGPGVSLDGTSIWGAERMGTPPPAAQLWVRIRAKLALGSPREPPGPTRSIVGQDRLAKGASLEYINGSVACKTLTHPAGTDPGVTECIPVPRAGIEQERELFCSPQPGRGCGSREAGTARDWGALWAERGVADRSRTEGGGWPGSRGGSGWPASRGDAASCPPGTSKERRRELLARFLFPVLRRVKRQPGDTILAGPGHPPASEDWEELQQVVSGSCLLLAARAPRGWVRRAVTWGCLILLRARAELPSSPVSTASGCRMPSPVLSELGQTGGKPAPGGWGLPPAPQILPPQAD